jgi:hypothetical protein
MSNSAGARPGIYQSLVERPRPRGQRRTTAELRRNRREQALPTWRRWTCGYPSSPRSRHRLSPTPRQYGRAVPLPISLPQQMRAARRPTVQRATPFVRVVRPPSRRNEACGQNDAHDESALLDRDCALVAEQRREGRGKAIRCSRRRSLRMQTQPRAEGLPFLLLDYPFSPSTAHRAARARVCPPETAYPVGVEPAR